jgi:transcriptional regulator with XRE-family HTH domain
MPSDLSIAFGKRLREVRREHGMSQDQLADQAGMHATTISRMERGLREPRVTTVLRLADGLGVHPGRLLEEPGTDAER